MVQVFGTMTGRAEPFLLRSDNFTSITRTPWAGTHIGHHYKRALLTHAQPPVAIGESWELSVGDELGSCDLQGVPLRDRIAADPIALLGAEARRGVTTALLVKLLDTADDLSVQIHPADDDPSLAPGEAGKTEAWLVVRADADSVIHLGLRDGVSETLMRERITTGADVSELLRAWPVRAGDFFVVEPGTPHAIGRGITLVEPQTATAGKRAMTYRYWDWNRRYDAKGRLDPSGTPRPLHVERALSVTRWPSPHVADPPMQRLGAPVRNAPARWQDLCSPQLSSCRSDVLRVAQLSGIGEVSIPDWNVLRALTVLEGTVRVSDAQGSVTVVGGQTAVLPASAVNLHAALSQAHAVVSAIAVP